MNHRTLMVMACGVVSMVIVHFAFWLNIRAGVALDAQYVCNPYLEGCVSTSRAVRSGPGLIWFKAVMLPVALLIGLSWRHIHGWMVSAGIDWPGIRRWTFRLGIGGAMALVFYVLFLGTDGEVYSWLRRYGVVFFFGFTALAQLLVARFVAGTFESGLSRTAVAFIAVVSAQWLIGVFSVFKRFMFSDADTIDRLQNITEWWMLLAMSLGFVFIALLLRRPFSRPNPS